MITLRREDAFHKAMMIRVLTAFLDNKMIRKAIGFKGGSCASMASFLNRLSVDLDFDLLEKNEKKQLKKEINQLLPSLGFKIKTQSSQELFFILKYNSIYPRNSLKLSIIDQVPASNDYQPIFLPDLNRFVICQTIETMFANKLVAVTERYKKYQRVAGRDIYDLHHFFSQGYNFKKEVIEERTGLNWKEYLQNLLAFIANKFNQKAIDEDLNFLLPTKKFYHLRRSLIPETLNFIKSELVEYS